MTMSMSRQNSLEQHWQDVNHLLDLDANDTAPQYNAVQALLMNNTAENAATMQVPDNALVQNTTLDPVPLITIGQGWYHVKMLIWLTKIPY